MNSVLIEQTSTDEIDGAASPLTTNIMYDKKGQTSQPITWATASEASPRTAVMVPNRMITGSAMGAVRPRIEIPRLIELYNNGRFKLDELVSGHYSFSDINEAIASMEKGDVIRNVLMF